MFRTNRMAAAAQRFARSYSTATTTATPPRHLTAINDLTTHEFTALIRNAAASKSQVASLSKLKANSAALAGQTVAMMFSKRSTRTRVSTEGAIALLGGHPMFLGSQDIQLGVNESLLDTSKVISSMVACMVARVGPHSDIVGLAQHSSVPVINALSDDFHPLQTIADFLTIAEAFPSSAKHGLGLEGLRIAWVGDSNNVLFDLASACVKLGVDISVASPKGYGIPDSMKKHILSAGGAGKLKETTVPEEAIKGADILVTDTWVSMGQEAEAKKRMKAFEGFQITNELAKRGGAKEGWKFMHCLPRHQEEVHDEVFYSERSLVFPEAQNRLWAAVGKYIPDGHNGEVILIRDNSCTRGLRG